MGSIRYFMTENSLKSKVVQGLFWKVLEQGGSQGIQFIVALVLARLMTPEEYGTISLITIFITIANTLVQSGFATALVQGKEVEDEDYSSVFWISMLLSVVLYIALFLGAPWIPTEDIAQFIEDTFRVPSTFVTVEYSPISGAWNVPASESFDNEFGGHVAKTLKSSLKFDSFLSESSSVNVLSISS